MRTSYKVGHNFNVVHQNYEPAMTFFEIATALGIRKKAVFFHYARAMEKIRREILRHPEVYREIAGLLAMRRREAPVFPDWGDHG